MKVLRWILVITGAGLVALLAALCGALLLVFGVGEAPRQERVRSCV